MFYLILINWKERNVTHLVDSLFQNYLHYLFLMNP